MMNDGLKLIVCLCILYENKKKIKEEKRLV